MESFSVLVHRRDRKKGSLAGMVEEVGRGRSRPFRSLQDLLVAMDVGEEGAEIKEPVLRRHRSVPNRPRTKEREEER